MLKIRTEASHSINIGDIIEVMFVSRFTDDPIGEIYSGFYLVMGVEHNINASNNTYDVDIMLTRDGFDGQPNGHVPTTKDYSQYVTDTLGR